ncbi:hypothetical protein M3221_17000 [Domibacillus indicus]|uniref:hypothetical protein n=1 Tax=Domibacillus indicus TaxID=1437523 RepID=UPI0020423494|nr:hypothetical protein [Domibacillus indicus]MCM3790087.1 hypothetical protein [Domibacillus indicus]
MQSNWTAKEKELLKSRSRFLFEKPKSGKGVPLSVFLEPAAFSAFLKKEAGRIGSDNTKVAASIFIKRYAFLLVGVLASWSFFRKPFFFSPQAIWLVDDGHLDAWRPKFFLDEAVCRQKHGRIEEALYHMNAVIESAKKATGISPAILRENLAVYIFWLYETVAEEKELSAVSKRAKKDFMWLLAPEQASLFGGDEANPLAAYFKEKEAIEGQKKPLRIRSTCCLNVKLKTGGKRCSVCPVQHKADC